MKISLKDDFLNPEVIGYLASVKVNHNSGHVALQLRDRGIKGTWIPLERPAGLDCRAALSNHMILAPLP